MRRLILLVGASCLLHAQAYKFARAWDGEKLIPSATIVVEGDKIKSIGTADVAGAIDLSKYTAIPGLIDVHTHMTYVLDTNRLTQAGRGAATVYLSAGNAKRTLETGVTTVRNLGASDYADIAMRDLINNGMMTGPRMFVSGYGLFITRGGRGGPGTADGTTEVMKVVRQQIGAGADVIKIYGSTGSGQDVSGDQTFTFEELKAAIDAAHALGKKVAVHSYGPTGARDAVHAGCDSLEHAINMDDQTIAEMAYRHTFYVPTIDHNRYYVDNARMLRYPDSAIAPLNDFIQKNLETAKKAYKGGVRFAMGSDAVYTMFGENTRELGWFVKAGMNPEQALKTATVNGAALLGMEDKLGALKPGLFADIVAVDGDPLADVNVVIDKVKWVMKGGAVVVDKTK